MNPTLRKAILFLVGATSLTREKIDSFIKELEKEGALDQEEGRKLFEQMMAKSSEKATEVGKQVREEVKKALAEMGFTAKNASTDTSPADAVAKPSCDCANGCKCEPGCDCECDCECAAKNKKADSAS